MGNIQEIEKCIDDLADIAVHAISAIKKHNILALPDAIALFKDADDLIKEFKLAVGEFKDISAENTPELTGKILAAFQKIMSAVK